MRMNWLWVADFKLILNNNYNKKRRREKARIYGNKFALMFLKLVILPLKNQHINELNMLHFLIFYFYVFLLFFFLLVDRENYLEIICKHTKCLFSLAWFKLKHLYLKTLSFFSSSSFSFSHSFYFYSYFYFILFLCYFPIFLPCYVMEFNFKKFALCLCVCVYVCFCVVCWWK